jgi:hypothetical protein
VLRLPFIFSSSLPHEVLHNWWGNGVLIDDRFGNWAEGLTTYQSDWFHDWISKIGQPQLEIANPFQESLLDSTFMVQFDLDQVPSPHLMTFDIPIEFTFQSGKKRIEVVRVDSKRRQTINFIFPERVTQFRIDPEFHVFRKVGAKERPAQLLSAFTSSEIFLYNRSLPGIEHMLVDVLGKRFSVLTKWHLLLQISDYSLLLPKTLFLIGFDQSIKDFIGPMLSQTNQNLRFNGYDIEFLDANLNWQKIERNSQDLIVVFKNPSDIKVPIVWVLPSHERTQSASRLKDFFTRLTHYASSTLLVLEQRRAIVNKTILPNNRELTHQF